MQQQAIGRFNIVRELGKGAQGAVYLAYDTQLDRQVAIKTLHAGSSKDPASLIREAKIASKLQHPNIVTLHDAILHDGIPYLVYAYIEGQTLAQLLKQEKTLTLTRAAQIASSVLEGLDFAHRQGVIHLDIKPGNVMMPTSGHPMIMDFGIAQAISQQSAEPAAEIAGTPQYMAPERFSAHGAELRSDLYAVGMMLYEMVTGSPAISGDNVYQILHQSAHGKADAPSSRNIHVDEKLEAIILKAIAKNPDERYPDAATMRQALQQYLDATPDGFVTGNGHSTLEFLIRRMRSKSDFPALSGIIGEINKVVASESESSGKLAQIILKDFALTNKLLKMVNTVSYGQFGGKINTISKAVVIIGFETVRNIAMTLILLDFLQNKAQAVELKDEIILALFAGIVAGELAPVHRPGFVEEAIICSMFQHLGKLLTTFYFFEESQQIARLLEEPDVTEEQAAAKVLGLSFNDLGIGIAKHWNFPAEMVTAMRKLPNGKIHKPAGGLDQLNITINLANELSLLAAISTLPEKEHALRQLGARYADVVQTSARSLSKALDNGLRDLAQRAALLGISTSKSPLLKKIGKWVGHEELAVKAGKAQDSAEPEKTLEQDIDADSKAIDNPAGQQQPEDLLNAGIQDVTNTLVEDYNLNDVLRMVLETIYRSLGFNRTLIFIRDGRQNLMVARFGFGERVDDVIPHCRFSLKFEPDVFHLAVEKGTDIVIEDVQGENIASKIPGWYREAIDAQSLLLLPIMINQKAIGLLYADMQQAHSLQLTQRQLAMLRTLRNQAVLAIKQKI